MIKKVLMLVLFWYFLMEIQILLSGVNYVMETMLNILYWIKRIDIKI